MAAAIFTGLGGAAAGQARGRSPPRRPVAASEIVALHHTFLAGFHAALTVTAGLTAVVRGDEGRSNHTALQINSSPGPGE